jgi:dihydrofolate reductase
MALALMPRRIRYQVACSLDGYIAGPNGDYDWILMDPDIDFGALFAQFDTLLMGRATYEVITRGGEQYPGMKVFVFSRTLRQEDHPGVTIVSDRIRETIDDLRAQPGKDIWLFGGGQLFQSLIDLDCVDTIEPAIIPVVLGEGIRMFPRADMRHALTLKNYRLYEKTGTMFLEYAINRESGRSD